MFIYFYNQLKSKIENAEVLELTVKRVENILQNRSSGKMTPTLVALHIRQLVSMKIMS